jgi:hypothetical protein
MLRQEHILRQFLKTFLDDPNGKIVRFRSFGDPAFKVNADLDADVLIPFDEQKWEKISAVIFFFFFCEKLQFSYP